MEAQNTSETLEEDSVVSKMGQAQNSCDNTLEEASGSSSSTENCTGSGSASEVTVAENGDGFDVNRKYMGVGGVEVMHQRVINIERRIECVDGESFDGGISREVDNGNNDIGLARAEKELVQEGVAGESQAKGVSLEPDFEEKNLAPALSPAVKDNENEKNGVEKLVMLKGVEEGNASNLHGLDSARKIDVSGDGISLVVEVFGPLNGIFERDNANCLEKPVSRASYSDQEKVSNRNEASFPNNGDGDGAKISESLLDLTEDGTLDGEAKGGNEMAGEANGDQECKFIVGDLVWVKAKTQSWWPGLICDPSNALEDAENFEHRECLLVGCFGSGNFVWCSHSQLKPFLANFEQMSRQSDSRSFLGAIEKAVGEIGQRVKMEMTCSCFSERSRTTLVAQLAAGAKEGEPMSEDKRGEFGYFLMTQFEPENLLAFIKKLAQEGSMPGMVEFTVMQNCLLAFHRAIGHLQLPMHELRPAAGPKDSVLEKKDGDPTKLSGGHRHVVMQKCGNSVIKEGIISAYPISKSSKRESSEDSGNSSNEAEDLFVHKMASSEVEMISSSISPEKIESKARGTGNGNGGSKTKFEKGFESRERKKSKYLSPPYINLNWGRKCSPVSGELDTEVSSVGLDVNGTTGQSMGAASMVKVNGKKAEEKLFRKTTIGYNIPGKPLKVNASSAEMLSELRFTALDCLYPSESEYFDSVERFFSGFRRLAFQDELNPEMASNHTVGLQESNHELPILQGLPEVEVQMEKGKGMEGVSVARRRTKLAADTYDANKAAGYPDLSTGVPQRVGHLSPIVIPKRRGRKKKEESTTAGSKTKAAAGFSDMNRNIFTSGSMIIDFQKTGPLAPKGKSVLKKRTKKTGKISELQQTKVMAGLPDLNGNDTSFLAGDLQVGGSAAHDGKPERKISERKEGAAEHLNTSLASLPDGNGNSSGLGPLLKDVQVMGPYSLESIPEPNNREWVKGAASLRLNTELIASQSDVNGNCTGGKPECTKRKRKEKASDCLQTNVTSAIPDLNGNAAEPGLLGKDLSGTNCIQSDGKPRQKRKRRNKAAAGMTDINAQYNNGEVFGTVLQLKFAPGFAMPSKEALVATFGEFGPLRESETQVLDDVGCAQVVFTKGSDAGDAFQSLEKSSPYGPALIGCDLRHFPAASRPLEADSSNVTFCPVNGFKTPAQPSGPKPQYGEAPDLSYIRQNLEMMTSMLGTAGDNLSPEMRAKLESEIKGLLKKVTTMVGSSSSS